MTMMEFAIRLDVLAAAPAVVLCVAMWIWENYPPRRPSRRRR